MPNDLKNDLDTKESINNTFISNQLNKTNNIELLKALENGFKLIDLSCLLYTSPSPRDIS